MTKLRVKLTFPQQLIREPLIYLLGKDYNVVTNIRRADVTADKGWVVLELDGEEEDVRHGVAWLTENGVRVDPVVGDLIEG